VSARTDNIGIINGWFESNGDYKIVIKNFKKSRSGCQDRCLPLMTRTSSQIVKMSTAQSSEYFSVSDLDVNPGVTKISIDSPDALAVDNNAFVVYPSISAA